ncbi:MAG: HIT family protein [Aquabacterium sp.]|nr:MAG: HIT family protein [Aquabacterium sp.]
MTRDAACELCAQPGGLLVHRTARWRVIRAADADHPGFYRVIWNAHVAEWTDLPPADRRAMLAAVEAVEQVLRDSLKPTKINLASLGNVVPHLHWHVIARFEWDARWPQPVWASRQRDVAGAEQRLALPLDLLDQAVARALAALA